MRIATMTVTKTSFPSIIIPITMIVIAIAPAINPNYIFGNFVIWSSEETEENETERKFFFCVYVWVCVCVYVYTCVYMWCICARACVGWSIALLNFFSDYIYKYYKYIYKRIHTRVKVDHRWRATYCYYCKCVIYR